MPISNFKTGTFNFKTIAIGLGIFFGNLFLFLIIFESSGFLEYGFSTTSFVFAATLSVLFVKSVYLCSHEHEQIGALVKDIAATKDGLAKNKKAWDTAVNIAAQEMRTPLQVIRGYASMVIDGTFGQMGDEARGIASRILEISERMSGVAESLLRQLEQQDFSVVARSEAQKNMHSVMSWHQNIALNKALATLSVLFVTVQIFFVPTTLQLVALALIALSLIFLSFYQVNEVSYEPESEDTIRKMQITFDDISTQLHDIETRRTAFLTQISTDFREPLESIMNDSAHLSQGPLEELSASSKLAVSKIFESSERLLSTISVITNTLSGL